MRKSRFITFLMFILLAMSLSSCFSIIEKISFNKDGSGTYAITFDMKEMISMIKMMGGSEDDSESMMDSLNTNIGAFKDRFESIDGISNARVETDKENYTFTALYDFDDVDALNKALTKYYEVDDQPVADMIFFTRSRKKLVRVDESPFANALQEQLSSEGMDMDMDLSAIFGDLKYETIMVFENKLRKVSKSDYEQDKNTLSLKYFPFKPEDKDKKLAVEVTFK